MENENNKDKREQLNYAGFDCDFPCPSLGTSSKERCRLVTNDERREKEKSPILYRTARFPPREASSMCGVCQCLEFVTILSNFTAFHAF